MAVSAELVLNGTHRVPVRLYFDGENVQRENDHGPYMVVRAFAYEVIDGVGIRLNGHLIMRPAKARTAKPAAAPVAVAPAPAPKARKANGHLTTAAASLQPAAPSNDWISTMLGT